ncbi:MAG TPA: DUF3187 family protein [Thermoanaerobaculia bacterium]|nr:DUF3187 family protein [Thermoanaerobaculia bacterium]
MWRPLVVLMTLVAAFCRPATGQEVLMGPLRIRDLSPLSLFRLDMPPAHAVNSIEHGWGVELTYSQANLFLVSDEVHAYLNERPTDGPVTEEEARALLARPAEVFFFDAEVTILSLTAGRAINRNWQAMITVPYHWYGGGILDDVIERFHQTIGLRDAGRAHVPRDRVQVFARLGGAERIVLTDEVESGFGDAVATLRYGRQLGEAWHGILETALKLPTGRDHLYFSKDEMDVGVQASIQYQQGASGYYASFSYIFVADDPFLPGVSDTPTLSLATERRILNDHTALLAQMTWSQSTAEGLERSDLTEDRMQISLGLRHRPVNANYTASVAITENVVHYKNTPDIGIHFGMAWILSDPK